MPSDKLDGFACLAFVARIRGVDTSLEALRRRYGYIDNKTSLDFLVSVAGDLGLSAKVIEATPSDLSRLKKLLPVLVQLSDRSIVVLSEVFDSPTAGWIVKAVAPSLEPDGQNSEVMVDRRQLEDVWTGYILLIKRNYRISDEERPFGLQWVAAQVLRERSLFRDIAIASLFSTAFALAPAFITLIVIDRVIVNHSVSTLWVVAGALFALVLFEMVLGYLRRLFIQVTATRIDGRITSTIKVLKLPMSYFERTPTGYTLGQLGQVGRIRSFLTGQLFGTFLELITLVGLVPALLILSWKLSIFVFICAAMIFSIIFVYLKPMGRLQSLVVAAEREKGIYLTETLYGMRAVKSLALEDRRRSEWDVRVAAALKASYNYGHIANFPQTFVLPFERAMYSGTILFGAALALSGPTTVAPGALIAFSMLAGRTGAPLVQLARLLQDLGEIRAAVAEVGAVMNQPSEELHVDTGMKLPVRGNIIFKSVDFRYASGAPLALADVSFEIRPGAIFGIMGRSGSGKTTITRLLQGLNPVYEGLIKIDGMDLREMDIHHLRLNIGVVPQENFLFSGTVRDNISIASPGANISQIVRAAQLAGAEEFIERLPRGYDTRLEEGASNLSGGQRQRLALARALLIDPPVLILDEATSALDAESEAIINANLARIASERTIICVSHRLSMLVPASAILVMERGEVYDIGRHEELLQRCDIYKHMWYTQNRHMEPNGPDAPYALTATHR